jgi:hypothetical protein
MTAINLPELKQRAAKVIISDLLPDEIKHFWGCYDNEINYRDDVKSHVLAVKHHLSALVVAMSATEAELEDWIDEIWEGNNC